MAPFQALSCSKALITNVAVGMGAASFWRGAWYLLDDHLYPDSPQKSAIASLSLGVAGMAASQGLVARAERLEQRALEIQKSMKGKQQTTLLWLGRFRLSNNLHSMAISAPRLGAIYTVAVSCVLVWRGTWVGWDCLYEYMHHTKDKSNNNAVTVTVAATDPGHATHSGLLSHVTAVGLLLTTGLFASVLAPPAAVSVIRDFSVRSTPKAASVAKAAVTKRSVQPQRSYQHQLQQLSLVTNQWRMSRALSSSAVTTSAAAANHAFRKVHLHQTPFMSHRQVSTLARTTR